MECARSSGCTDAVGKAVSVKSRVSDLLDATIAPGFSRIGYLVRSRLNHWESVESFDCQSKTFVITGPTAGLGKATAFQLAATGATLVLVARNANKLEELVTALRIQFPQCKTHSVIADMGDLAWVAHAASEIRGITTSIDALVHNAGALLPQREVTVDGNEVTVATHVLGPHLMTTLLREQLKASHGRVIMVSSGGMYAATLPAPSDNYTLELPAHSYDGTKQYAIAKRAQVTLNEMWAQRETEIVFASMHPGWADTPGVQSSLPGFRRVTQPILRSPQQGADTIAWLAAIPVFPGESGKFWSDREVRSIHKTISSRRADTQESRSALWQWCDAAIAQYLTK